MVWGCISCEGTGLITKMEGRMNGKDYSRLLFRQLLPYMQSSYVFMDGNAPCHQCQAAIRWIFKCFQTLGRYCIREDGSTLYVGLARAVSPTNTNFRLPFLLTRLQEALYEDLAV